jgi:hypothetical protein
MSHDRSLRLNVVLNATVVLVLAVFQLSLAGGRPIDHERVRPWGCRTCPIPATESSDRGNPTGASAPGLAPAPTACDGDCPGWVEMLLAACQAACPPGSAPAPTLS